MMNNKKEKNNLFFWFAGILILILIISSFFFYRENYFGTIKIETPSTNVKIFIDGKRIKPLSNNLIRIKKGVHAILISKKNSWPWAKTVKIAKRQITKVYPFFVPKQTSGYMILKSDQEYKKIMSLFKTNKTHIDWKKDKNTPTIIRKFEPKIKSSDFYKDRNDVIIISILNGIYALEINSESKPNFQPIYKGKDPEFIKKDNQTLYVKDNNHLMEIKY